MHAVACAPRQPSLTRSTPAVCTHPAPIHRGPLRAARTGARDTGGTKRHTELHAARPALGALPREGGRACDSAAMPHPARSRSPAVRALALALSAASLCVLSAVPCVAAGSANTTASTTANGGAAASGPEVNGTNHTAAAAAAAANLVDTTGPRTRPTAGLNNVFNQCVQDSKKVDVLFVLDASRTVLQKHNETNRTKLAQSLEFVVNALGNLVVSEDEINVGVISFSNIAATVLAFNTTYNYTAIQETLLFPELVSESYKVVKDPATGRAVGAEFNNTYSPGNPMWIRKGGKYGFTAPCDETKYKFCNDGRAHLVAGDTDYIRTIDGIRDVLFNAAHGNREGVHKLIFVVSDGLVPDDRRTGKALDAVGCVNESQFDKTGRASPDEVACYHRAMRAKLMKQHDLHGGGVDSGYTLYAIGVGGQDQTNEATLQILAGVPVPISLCVRGAFTPEPAAPRARHPVHHAAARPCQHPCTKWCGANQKLGTFSRWGLAS